MLLIYRATLKKKIFISSHKNLTPIKTLSNGNRGTFWYIGGHAPETPAECSKKIAPGITVLKLGGVKIDGWHKFNYRNLDFTNLDFLEIDGKKSSINEHEIFYSSCGNIAIKNATATFTKFYNCEFHNLKIIESRIQGVEFINCDLFQASFESSSISDLVIEKGSVNGLSFNRVEVENINYKPPKTEWHCGITNTYKSISNNYKKFRILYQSNGMLQEASDSYYLERKYDLKYNFQQLNFVRTIKYFGDVNTQYGIDATKFYFKSLGKVLLSFVSWLIWGFGERPVKIFRSTFFVLFLYSLYYFFSRIGNHNVIDSIYFSGVTFTTLGFGDIKPVSDLDKVISVSEALIGAFFMGLLVAGFANKSKY